MSQIVFYFLHTTSVLSSYIDAVLTISIKQRISMDMWYIWWKIWSVSPWKALTECVIVSSVFVAWHNGWSWDYSFENMILWCVHYTVKCRWFPLIIILQRIRIKPLKYSQSTHYMLSKNITINFLCYIGFLRRPCTFPELIILCM